MSEEKRSINTGGVGVVGLLGVAFVVLKLCKVIDWSWWWVTVPFWGPIGAAAVIFIAAMCVIGVAEIVKK